MSKKQIEMWDVEIRFRVRKGSYSAESKKELLRNITNGIGKNDMNCIEEEDLKVIIKEEKGETKE